MLRRWTHLPAAGCLVQSYLRGSGGMTVPRHARRHHYVPRFYLAGFTRSGRANDRLWVHDLQRLKRWRATPSSTGFQTDYYAVNTGVLPADAMEKALSDIERQAAPVIADVVERQELPGDKDMQVLLAFAAHLAARGPRSREAYVQSEDKIAKARILRALRTPGLWESFLAKTQKEWQDTQSLTSPENLERCIKEDLIRADVPQALKLKSMSDMQELLFRHFMQMPWALRAAGQANLVSCDSPVSLFSDLPPPLPAQPQIHPGSVVVCVPLCGKLALVSRPEAAWPVEEATIEETAWINTATCLSAARYVYSATKRFVVQRRDGTATGGGDYLRVIDECRNEQERRQDEWDEEHWSAEELAKVPWVR